MERFDAAIVGAGAAGLYCAAWAGQRGQRVLLIDHSERIAEKIRISGGGRCNFTNVDVGAPNFLSDNPDFCRSALARHTSADFVSLVRRHGIAFHEKHRGQLFCDGSSRQIVSMLLHECEQGAVQRWQPCQVHTIQYADAAFELATDRGPASAQRLVIATGGLSIPKIGATDFGYRIARQFGHRVIEPRPALVPLTFDAGDWRAFAGLAGVSLPVHIQAGRKPRGQFDEDLLFTHRGLSGPAALQASSYWQVGQAIDIDLTRGSDMASVLHGAKATSKRQLANELAQHLPQRLASAWLGRLGLEATTPMPQLRDREIDALASALCRWQPQPTGTEGWAKAEVTAGGVDTRELDSRSMESRLVQGLYFIGEVVDVTGWLGGYNFQWAWSSAHACAQSL
jgi:predicted Rossmann fold flavoprotein